jgi:UDP-glucose 4-epimerase
VRGKEADGMSEYRGRRTVVIGGLGYIGRRLAGRLAELGARVTVVTPAIAHHRAAAAESEALGVHVLEGDLRDHAAMRRAVDGQDVVFNLAGRSGAVQSVEDPGADLDVNCRGSLVLLDCLRSHAPSVRLVFVSSRLVYGRTREGAPVREDADLAPLCPHAVHKAAVERYLDSYNRLFDVPFTVARLTNPYGPGQPQERTAYGVINRLIHLALLGRALPIYGDGCQRRDYIYLDDAVEALVALGVSGAAAGRIYNVGSGVGTHLVDAARRIISEVGQGHLEFLEWPTVAAQIETGDFVADVTRIGSEVGWAPRVSFEEGLRRTVAFYRSGAVYR